MKLDIIIPTYNRAGLLRQALGSLEAAHLPAGLTARVIVADNRSSDQTQEVVGEFARLAKLPVQYLFCGRKQGRSAAINDALHHATADLVGFIDDDEKVREDWFSVIYRCFQDENLGLLGGPCVAVLEGSLPKWIPKKFRGVLTIAEPPASPLEYASTKKYFTYGGNAVFRRSLLIQVGDFPEDLGRTDRRLLSCEDVEIFQRMLALDVKGIHHPELVIYHHIPRARISKAYFRKWVFWDGVSHGRVEARHWTGPCWFGIPRWLFRASATALARRILSISRPEEQQFSEELTLIHLMGRIYSRWFNPDA